MERDPDPTGLSVLLRTALRTHRGHLRTLTYSSSSNSKGCMAQPSLPGVLRTPCIELETKIIYIYNILHVRLGV